MTGSPPLFDGTPFGIACGQLYLSAVQTIGRQFGWDFSRNVAALSLTGSTPPLGLAYEYAYPTNGIQVRQLVPETVDANDPRPIDWVVGNSVGPSTAATGFIQFDVNPSPSDTITLNGAVFTFVASGATPTNFQSNIGGNIGGTLALLVNVLPPNGYSGTPQLTVASYSRSSPRLIVTYGTLGTAGNSDTLAASAATVSGPTLTGGASAAQKVIWTNLADAQAAFSNQPPEDTWDPAFTEAVVRWLASELALAISNTPETSKLTMDSAIQMEGAGEQRFDT